MISVAQSPEANEFTNDSEAVKVNSITEHRKIWIYSDTTLGAKKLLEQATSLSGKKVCVFFIRELGELGRLNDNTYTGQVDHVFEDSEEGWKSHNSWVQGE